MARTTPGEVITRRLREAYDVEYYDSLHRLTRYAYGDPMSASAGWRVSQDGEFPYFPDVVWRYAEVGQSRRVLTSAFIGLSRVMYSQPSPEYPELDALSAEVRRQFILRRARGDGWGDGEWGFEDEAVFLDGDGLGYGCAQIVLLTNPETGLQRVGIQHVPAVHVLRDWHARNPFAGRWRCLVHLLSEEDGEELYGAKTVREKGKVLYNENGRAGVKVLRIFEYYDGGNSQWAATRAIIVGDIDQAPLEIKPNPFGSTIPVAEYAHWTPPMARHPIGRIGVQMATQEARNDFERHMKQALGKPAIDLVDMDQVDQADLMAWTKSPDKIGLLKFSANADGRPPFFRHPSGSIDPGVFNYLNLLDREANAESGVSDFERGNLSSSTRTLGENQLLDSRSQTQGSWSRRAAMAYHRRKLDKVVTIARMFDRDEVRVPLSGTTVTLNDPNDPATYIDKVLSQESSTVISEESLEYRDLRVERLLKSRDLMQLADLVQTGVVDMAWWAGERIKAAGFDPKVAQAEPGAAQAQAQAAMSQQPQPPMPEDPAAMDPSMMDPAAMDPAAMMPGI